MRIAPAALFFYKLSEGDFNVGVKFETLSLICRMMKSASAVKN